MALYSEFYREGILNKAGKGIIQAHLHSWRPRYFVLNGLQLKYYKTKPSKEMLPENMLGCIEMSEVESISVMKNEKNAFQITTKSPKSTRTYYMSGKSDDEIQGWIKCLAMAKAKYQEEAEKKPSSAGHYDEPSVNKSPPTKPPRSPSVSESRDSPAPPVTPGAKPVISQYAFVGFPADDEKAAVTGQKTGPNKENHLYQDPTYDSIDDNASTKNKKQSDKNSEPDSNLYDTYDAVMPLTKETATKNNKSTDKNSEQESDLYDAVAPVTLPKKATSKQGASDPLPATTVPPPLPARLPSMSDDPKTTQKDKITEGSEIGVYDDVGTNIPSTTKAPIGVYGEVGTPNIPDTTKAPIGVYGEVGTPNIPDATKVPIGVYDEVGTPNIPDATKAPIGVYGEVRIPNIPDTNKAPIALYDEVGTPSIPDTTKAPIAVYGEVGSPDIPISTKFENEIPNGLYDEIGALDIPPIKTKSEELRAKNEESPAIDPTHVYAKPIKSPQNSLKKRTLSKRKLIPGLMDVGEVPIDVEEDAAGGKKTLERGMTKPTGDRFAIEELREVLTEYDAEMNNNGGEMLEDFDVNQSESAFEVLRRFLERCS